MANKQNIVSALALKMVRLDRLRFAHTPITTRSTSRTSGCAKTTESPANSPKSTATATTKSWACLLTSSGPFTRRSLCRTYQISHELRKNNMTPISIEKSETQAEANEARCAVASGSALMERFMKLSHAERIGVAVGLSLISVPVLVFSPLIFCAWAIGRVEKTDNRR